MRMDAQEASVSDPVSAISNQATPALSAPSLAAPVNDPQAAKTGSTSGGTQGSATAASAATDASKPSPATDASKPSPATTLELSAASGVTKTTSPPTMTMEEAAQAYQTYLSNLPSNLQLQPNTEAGMVVIKVINPVTQKVIRQFPSDDMIQQAKFLRNAEKQNHSGILLDEKF